MLLFELDFEEVSKKKLRECWSQLCRIRCTIIFTAYLTNEIYLLLTCIFASARPEDNAGGYCSSHKSLVNQLYSSKTSTVVNLPSR